MKQFTLINILLLMLVHSVVVNAQQKKTLWLNITPGINSTWLINQNAYGNPEFEYATSFGLTGGIGLTYFSSRHWGFNSSLLLSKLGQNYSGVQSGGDANRKVKLLYLEIPLMVIKDIPGQQYPTWISFGPDILILLNAEQQYSREGGNSLPNPDGMINGSVKDRYKLADVAISFSVNRMYNLDYFRKMMFLFSVNAALGLTDINTTEWQIPNTHNVYTGSHNFYIGIKVGMMFKVARFGNGRW